MKKCILIIATLMIILSSCSSNELQESNTSLIYYEYSIEDRADAKEQLKSAIEKDIWYYGKYSTFYSFIDEPIKYSFVTNKYLINYFIEMGTDENGYDAYLFICIDDFYSEPVIVVNKKLSFENKEAFYDYIKNEFDVDRLGSLDTISGITITQPQYIKTERGNVEIEKIKTKIVPWLKKAGVTGDVTLYIREFIQTDISGFNETDVFVVENETGEVYHSKYSAQYYQSPIPDDETGEFSEFKALKKDDERENFFYNKVKETTTLKFDLMIE